MHTVLPAHWIVFNIGTYNTCTACSIDRLRLCVLKGAAPDQSRGAAQVEAEVCNGVYIAPTPGGDVVRVSPPALPQPSIDFLVGQY